MYKKIRIIAAVGTAIVGYMAFSALALDRPKGPVVLTVSGKITQTNQDGKAVLDLSLIHI